MMRAPENISDSRVRGANMRPIWGWQDPGGPHVVPMNFVIWAEYRDIHKNNEAQKKYVHMALQVSNEQDTKIIEQMCYP